MLHNYVFKGLFSRGKQGIAGLLEENGNTKRKGKGKPHYVVFKFSQNIDYATRHEYNVQRSLNTLAKICPHFVQTHSIESARIDALLLKQQNPFIAHSRFQVDKQVMIMDYINDGIKLKDAIKSKLNMKQIFAVIKQVLQALVLAQKEVGYTHYDLHSNNIILQQCDPSRVIDYKQANGSIISVPTLGYIPIIIDHGFGYTHATAGERLYASLGHTKVGFYSDRHNPYADARLFLITLSSEIKHYFPEDENAKKLRRIVRNVYSAMSIDFYSGWDIYNGKDSASDSLIYVLTRLGESISSSMLIEGAHFAIDLVLSLNILPLTLSVTTINPISEFTSSAKTFFNLYKNYIEKVINNTYFSLYVLRDIVDAAANCNLFVKDKNNNEHYINDYFKNSVLSAVHSIAKFAVVDCNLPYAELLSSLQSMAKAGGHYVAQSLKGRELERMNEYKYVDFKTPSDLYDVIQHHFSNIN